MEEKEGKEEIRGEIGVRKAEVERKKERRRKEEKRKEEERKDRVQSLIEEKRREEKRGIGRTLWIILATSI